MNQFLFCFLRLFILFAIFCSCSSQVKKNNNFNQSSVDLSTQVNQLNLEQEDYSQIDQKHFMKPDSIRYNSYEDYYTIGNPKVNALLTESLSRLTLNQLKTFVSLDDLLTIGIAKCYQGLYVDGLKALQDQYDLYKLSPSYWNQIGTCYLLQGNLRKSIFYYNRALELKKDYAPSLNNIGIVHQKMGQDESAMLSFQKAFEVSSFSMTPNFNLAHMYLKYGHAQKAKNIFQYLLKNNPNDPDILNALANCELLLGDISQAYQIFSSLPKDKMTNFVYSGNFSLVLFLKEKKAEAMNLLKSSKVDKENAEEWAYYERLRNLISK
jgi:tetratricopeptide (TPR) repeat protein